MFLLCRDHDIGLCERHKDQCLDTCDPQPDERVKGCMICDGRLLPREDRKRPSPKREVKAIKPSHWKRIIGIDFAFPEKRYIQ